MGLPPQGFSLGPLELRFYAVMIMSGLVAGIFLARYEARRRGEDPEHVFDIALWGFLSALVGARLYHVLDADNIGRYLDQPELIIQIWRGGLGIFGAIVGALVALLVYTRVKRLSVLTWLDIGAPAFLLGQAIGRWGNYFNQELFGRPTDLPWAIPISPERVLSEAPQYVGATHFHPLFLYESLLSLLGVVVLLTVARVWRHRLLPGDIFAMYFLWYPGSRFAVEFLRADRWEMGGLPMAQLISLTLIAVATAVLVWRHMRQAPPAAAGGA
jgi:phosphatidylglycerol---prolipoprotein diacylglyceryl transferase